MTNDLANWTSSRYLSTHGGYSFFPHLEDPQFFFYTNHFPHYPNNFHANFNPSSAAPNPHRPPPALSRPRLAGFGANMDYRRLGGPPHHHASHQNISNGDSFRRIHNDGGLAGPSLDPDPEPSPPRIKRHRHSRLQRMTIYPMNNRPASLDREAIYSSRAPSVQLQKRVGNGHGFPSRNGNILRPNFNNNYRRTSSIDSLNKMATSRLDQLPNSHHRAYNNPDTDWANNFSTRDNFSRERTSSTPPNVRLLREINRRAKVAEKSLVYVKIVGFVHLLLGLAILSVEWAKLLLVWAYLNSAEKKLSLVLRVCYPLYIVAIGTVCMAAGIVNKKGATQLTMVSVIALLAPFCVLPNAAPFVTSMLEAIQVGKIKDSVTPNGARSQNFAHGQFLLTSPSPELIQSALKNRFMKYLHAETIRSGSEQPLGIYDISRVSRGNLQILQHLLIAYSSLSLFHCFVCFFTLFVTWRLLNVQ